MALTMSLGLVATVVCWIVWAMQKSKRIPKGLRELPGPRGYPLIGNILDFPKSFGYRKMKEWADQYGPIYKLNIMGGTHIVLSTETAANDLLAMKGSIYSDRPHMTMAYELVSRSGNLATTPANKYWRNARRFGQTVLSSPAAANVWQPRQAAEAPRLALELLENPDRYGYLFELFATVLSLRQGFGKILPRGGPEEAYHVKMIMTITHTIEATSQPGAYIVDFIPALKYLPDFLAPFKAEARTLFDFEYSYFSQLFADARKRHEEGKSMDPPCFADTYFDKESFWDMSDFEATYAMATFYEGGSGTTSAAMQSFCLAMCHYPNWQTRLQEELDRVVGTDRLPAFDDMPNLPTVRAVVKEVLRWRPVVPGGIPHCVREDDSYDGYFIPKGAIIHANSLAMSRQEADFPDAEAFNPDRWLSPQYPSYQEPITQFPNLKRYSAFGFGRRICPGLESAERSLFIQVATIGWSCNIRKKKDAAGKDIPVHWYDYTTGNNTAPKKFEFDIKPRDENRVKVLQDNMQEPF